MTSEAVIKEHATFALFGGIFIHSWSPEMPCRKPDSPKPPCCAEAQAKQKCHVLVNSPRWIHFLSHSSPATRYVCEKASRGFHPQLFELGQVMPSISWSREAILPVPCLNSWPTESVSIIKWWLFYTTTFGALLYSVFSTGSPMISSSTFFFNFSLFSVYLKPKSTWESFDWLKG